MPETNNDKRSLASMLAVAGGLALASPALSGCSGACCAAAGGCCAAASASADATGCCAADDGEGCGAAYDGAESCAAEGCDAATE